MFQSRLRKLAAELVPITDGAAKAAAELIAARAKARVPVQTGRLREAIHLEHEGPGEYAVVAGDNVAFYGHIIEHGSVHVPPRPFLMPAAEEARGEIEKIFAEALRVLT